MAVMLKIAVVKKDRDNDAISISHLISSHFNILSFSHSHAIELKPWGERDSDLILNFTFRFFTLNTVMSSDKLQEKATDVSVLLYRHLFRWLCDIGPLVPLERRVTANQYKENRRLEFRLVIDATRKCKGIKRIAELLVVSLTDALLKIQSWTWYRIKQNIML